MGNENAIQIEIVRLLMLNVDVMPDDVRIWCAEVLKEAEKNLLEKEKKMTPTA